MTSSVGHKPPSPFEVDIKRHFCRHLMPSYTCTQEACIKDFQEWKLKNLGPMSSPLAGGQSIPQSPQGQVPQQPAQPLQPWVSRTSNAYPRPAGCPLEDPSRFPGLSFYNTIVIKELTLAACSPKDWDSALLGAFSWSLSLEGIRYWGWVQRQPTLLNHAHFYLQCYIQEYNLINQTQGPPNASSPTP